MHAFAHARSIFSPYQFKMCFKPRRICKLVDSVRRRSIIISCPSVSVSVWCGAVHLATNSNSTNNAHWNCWQNIESNGVLVLTKIGAQPASIRKKNRNTVKMKMKMSPKHLSANHMNKTIRCTLYTRKHSFRMQNNRVRLAFTLVAFVDVRWCAECFRSHLFNASENKGFLVTWNSMHVHLSKSIRCTHQKQIRFYFILMKHLAWSHRAEEAKLLLKSIVEYHRYIIRLP